jgi:hypothetical protein
MLAGAATLSAAAAIGTGAMLAAPAHDPTFAAVTAELMRNFHATCHMAYGFTFLSPEQIAKAVAKEIATGTKALSHLIADCSTTHDELEALINIRSSTARKLASLQPAPRSRRER